MDLKLHYRPVKEEKGYGTVSEKPEEKEDTAETEALSPDGEEDEFYDEEDPETEENNENTSKEEVNENFSKEVEQENTSGEVEQEDASEEENKNAQEQEWKKESSSVENRADDHESLRYNMIIEAETLEKAFHIAVEEIKYFHKKYGVDFKVAKINADKLNEKGFASFKDKLEERDLIIESAGKLKYSVLDEIEQYIKKVKESSSIVLIDEVDHFDRLAEDRPKFLEYFDIVSGGDEEDDLLEDVDLDAAVKEREEKSEEKEDEAVSPDEEYLDEEEEPEEEYVPHKPSIFERPARPYKEVLEEEAEKEQPRKEALSEPVTKQQEVSAFPEKEEQTWRDKKPSSKSMDIEDFARYAIDYASSIDCSITDKGITALYERIQLMEEDGIVLNEESARDLIEETADQAEKPGLGKKIGSLFRPKYDKDDKLILREEHFMG